MDTAALKYTLGYTGCGEAYQIDPEQSQMADPTENLAKRSKMMYFYSPSLYSLSALFKHFLVQKHCPVFQNSNEHYAANAFYTHTHRVWNDFTTGS
jgi:hypothetical protein